MGDRSILVIHMRRPATGTIAVGRADTTTRSEGGNQ